MLLVFDPSHPFPFLADHSNNLLVVLEGDSGPQHAFITDSRNSLLDSSNYLRLQKRQSGAGRDIHLAG